MTFWGKPFDIPVWSSPSTASRSHQHQKRMSILILANMSPRVPPSIILHTNRQCITQRKFRHTTKSNQLILLHTRLQMTSRHLNNLLTLGYIPLRVITRIHWSLHLSLATISKLQSRLLHIPDSTLPMRPTFHQLDLLDFLLVLPLPLYYFRK